MSRTEPSKVSSKAELCEKLKDLVVEKQQTRQRVKELDSEIQKLDNSHKSKG